MRARKWLLWRHVWLTLIDGFLSKTYVKVTRAYPPSTPPRTTCGISGCSNYEKMTVSGKLKRQNLNAPSKKNKKNPHGWQHRWHSMFFLLPNTLFWIWPLTCLKGRSYKKKKENPLQGLTNDICFQARKIHIFKEHCYWWVQNGFVGLDMLFMALCCPWIKLLSESPGGRPAITCCYPDWIRG